MAYVKNLFDKNFLEYASYVIRDRAIPDLEDGLKPVQRRFHKLFLHWGVFSNKHSGKRFLFRL